MREWIAGLALVVVAGCGGGGGGDKGGGNQPPPPSFSIVEDMNGTTYGYRFGSFGIGCTYEPTSQLVVCVMDAATTVPLAFFGTVTGDRTMDIRLAALDTDEDGDFFEELSLPIKAGSGASFADDGSSMTIDLTITLDPTSPLVINGTADLVQTSNGNARLARAIEWASRVGR